MHNVEVERWSRTISISHGLSYQSIGSCYFGTYSQRIEVLTSLFLIDQVTPDGTTESYKYRVYDVQDDAVVKRHIADLLVRKFVVRTGQSGQYMNR
jgi:hypothetical protein